MPSEESLIGSDADGDDGRGQFASLISFGDIIPSIQTYLPTVGLVFDLEEGDRTDSARSRPVVIDVSLNDLLLLLDLPAP